jgi:hypothetical protein
MEQNQPLNWVGEIHGDTVRHRDAEEQARDGGA